MKRRAATCGALGLIVAGLVMASCGRGASRSAPEAGGACERARAQRARVAGLLAAGKLDRSLRVLARCSELCPRDAPLGWADEVATLAAIGRDADALKLADAIEASSTAGRDARDAASRARSVVKGQARLGADALVAAGLAAKSAGDDDAAQRRFDQAIEALRQSPGAPDIKPEVLDEMRFVGAVAWSPRGDHLAATVEDTVVVFDTRTWRPSHRFEAKARALAFAPDGRTLAAADGTTVRLLGLDADPGATPPSLEVRLDDDARSGVDTLAFSPDGKTLAVGNQGGQVGVLAVDPPGGVRLLKRVVTRAERVGLVAFSRDGGAVRAVLLDGTVRAFPLGPGAAPPPAKLPFPVGTSHDDPNDWSFTRDVLALSADGTMVADGPANGDLRLATIGSAAPSRKLWPVTNCLGAAFSPDGKAIAWGSANALHVTPLDPAAAERILAVEREPAWSLAFSPDGNTLASTQRELHLWHLDSSRQPQPIPFGASGAVFSPDGSTLALVGTDGTLRVFSAGADAAPAPLDDPSLPRARVRAASFSPDSKTIASGDDSGGVRLWTVHAPSGPPRALDGGSHRAVRSVAFSPDGKSLAAGSDDAALRVWTLSSTAPPVVLEEHKLAVTGVAFAPDGKTLASASSDRTVRLWPFPSGGPPRVLEQTSENPGVAFSADGKWLAAGNRLWEVGAVAAPRPLDGARAAAFSADGRWIATSVPRGIELRRTAGAARALTLVTQRADGGASVATAITPDGHVALYGDGARDQVVCRAGTRLYPMDVCAERFVVPDLFPKVLARDESYLLP